MITRWNAIAVGTIAGPIDTARAAKANAEAFSWYALVHAALYKAVVDITAEYEPYEWNARAPERASAEAAAAVAAHGILMEYLCGNPLTTANLDPSLTTSLAQIPEGVSKQQGIRYGERAADRTVRPRAEQTLRWAIGMLHVGVVTATSWRPVSARAPPSAYDAAVTVSRVVFTLWQDY